MESKNKRVPVVELKDVDMTFFKHGGLFRPLIQVRALTKVNLSIYPGEVVALVGPLINTPRHPYLQTLISVAPIPDPWIARNRRKIVLRDADPPAASNPPPGCRFHTRCSYAQSICDKKLPELRLYDGRMVACHLVEELPTWSLNDYSNAEGRPI